MFVTLDDARKKGLKPFSIVKLAPFWIVCFIDLLGPKEMLLSCAQSMSKHLVDSDKLFPVIFHVRWNEKKEAKVFSSLERLPCFSQHCVLNNLAGPKKRSFLFQSNFQKSLMTLITCSLMFVTLDDTRKRAKNFFHCENSSFLKCSFSIGPLGPKERISSFAQNVNIPCVPIQYVPWLFSCSIKREKLSQNLFFAGKAAFFQNFAFPTTS